MKFCSRCGHSPLLYQIPVGDNRARYQCPNCNTTHYQNPKIVCGCLVLYENQVMLCKRAIEPALGKWNLPAGFMENGETLKEGAQREVWEEANAKVELHHLHVVYNIMHVNQVYFLFLATLKAGEFSIGMETADIALFDWADIPWADLAFDSNRFALERYLAAPDYKGVHHGSSLDL